MATGIVITNNGRKICLNRTFKATPDYLAPTQFKIGTGTTTPAVTDTDLETPVNIDGDNFKDIVSGYPVLDETNMQATIRSLVLTTEANGNSLTEYGLVNEDGTRLLFSHSVHTAVTKTTSVQVIYIEKDKVKIVS